MVHDLEVLEDHQAHDVVVVGAGMVGASATIGLKKMGLSVLLVEAFAIPETALDYTPSYDARSTALSRGSRDILSQLGVWHSIQKHACPIDSVHVSERGRFGVTQMDAAEFNQEALGYVVPNQWLGQCLLSHLEFQNVPLCAPAKITGITTTPNAHALHLSSDGARSKTVTSKLLLIVDGANSQTAALIGIDSSVENYQQHALIANVSTELSNQGIAYERFTQTGPIAMLPLSESTSSLIWTHDDSDIQRYMNMSDAEFCRQLQESFGDRLGRVTHCGQRNTYPLRLIRAREQYRPGILLLGNAAHSLHPVAGQGFNLALRGVAALLESYQLVHSDKSQNDHDSATSTEMLRRFCEARKQDQANTIMFSDQLIKIFGSDSLLIGLSRDLGLIGLNNLPAVKRLLTRNAMGLGGKKARFGGLHA